MQIELSNSDIGICLEALNHYHKILIKEGYDFAEVNSPTRATGWKFYQSGIVSNVKRRFSERLDEFCKELAEDERFIDSEARECYADVADPLHKS